MGKFGYAVRIDVNQPKIVEGLRRFGAVVKSVHIVKDLFDILVAYNGRLYALEIKNPDMSPSKKRLTDGESRCKADFEGVGVPYYVVETLEDAIKIISA